MNTQFEQTPRQLGYRFPAEWEKHESTWLSFPHRESSWPGRIESIFPIYFELIKILAKREVVNINVLDAKMRTHVLEQLEKTRTNMANIRVWEHPTNDAWCRDHGAAFVINPKAENPKAVVNWKYNAWGGKYPPYDLDDQIPLQMAKITQVPVFEPNIVMEGGAIEVNGAGTLLSTRNCLLTPSRNPHLNEKQVEHYLREYYGVENIIWVEADMAGDDTDGHIDQLARFVNSNTVVVMAEADPQEDNYESLKSLKKQLQAARLENGKPMNIVEIQMPKPIYYSDQRVPASYANFYIANGVVIVPIFKCDQDKAALDILEKCFPKHEIIGLDSTNISWGLGSFHCLSQQEPAI